METRRWVLVDAGLFCAGMYIRAGLYYREEGRYVLLCRDVVLTREIIGRIQQIAEIQDGVFIDETDYEEIWNASLEYFSQQGEQYGRRYRQVRMEYNRILSNTFYLLGDVAATRGVPLNVAEDISVDIVDKFSVDEPALTLNCVHMISEADNYLYTHSVDVATLNGMLGRWMNLPDRTAVKLAKIGLTHDLGKLKIPPYILYKPGKLTKEEFEIMKCHPAYSYDMLMSSGEEDPEVLWAVRQHHEKKGGGGYPDGLRGEDITLLARITAVSDVYDAMVSRRCYKNAQTPFEVMELLESSRFFDLDQEIVKVFLQNLSYLLVGMRVTLSTGEEGEVAFIRPGDYRNPIVRVGDRVIATGPDCKCVSTGKIF